MQDHEACSDSKGISEVRMDLATPSHTTDGIGMENRIGCLTTVHSCEGGQQPHEGVQRSRSEGQSVSRSASGTRASRHGAERNAPEAVLVHLDQDRLRQWPEVRRALALALYQEGSLSAGNAARFADLALAEFIEAASRQGIPVVHGNSQTLAEEASAIKAWRTDS